MKAALFRARTEMRAHAAGAIVLMIVLGLFAGAAAAAVAGGRRTASAHPRFLETNDSFDAFVGDFSVFAPQLFWKADFDWIQSLPYVARAAESSFFLGQDSDQITAPHDARFGTEQARNRVVQGRLPDPRRADEVVVPFQSEQRSRARIGQTLDFPLQRRDFRPARVSVRVVGVVAGPGHFPPLDLLGNDLIATPAFYERYGQELLVARGLYVWFKGGPNDIDRLKADLQSRTQGKLYSLFDMRAQARNVQRSFDLEAVALWFIGAFLALAVAVVFAPALARHVNATASDNTTLRALGMTAGDLRIVAAIRAVAVLAGGGAIAAGVMTVLSPAFPRGLARIAEPNPGVSFDATAFVLTLVPVTAVIAIVIARAIVAARAARVQGEAARARPSRVATWAARVGLSPAAVSGAQLALEPGSGAGAVPVRATVAAASLSLIAILAAFTFGASLRHLLDTPRVYGKGWDVAYGFEDPQGPVKNLTIVRSHPDVAAAEIGSHGIPLEADDVATNGLLIAGSSFSVVTPLLEGSFPGDGEVALGPRIMAALGKEVGDRVAIGPPGAAKISARISGVVVLPPMSETMQLGEGALLEYASATRGIEAPPPDELLVRFRDGIDPAAAAERVRAKLIEPDQDFSTQSPRDLVNLGRVDTLPVVLATLLGALSVAVVGHLLVTAVTRRRRDLAVLKTLGFVRGQVSRTVAWQASIVMGIALLFAMPVGLAFGRWLWAVLAGRLGVHVEPVFDVLPTVLTPPIALLLANVAAALPGRAAARTEPAVVLRSE